MKMMLITTVTLAIAVPALAQSYNPDLGPAGNVVPPPGTPRYFGYPGSGYWGPGRPYWGAPGVYDGGVPADRQQRRRIRRSAE